VTTQNRAAQMVQLFARDSEGARAPRAKFEAVFPQTGTPWVARHQVLTAPDSPIPIPCAPPPWGTLLAVDLDTGEKRWEVPFGTTRGLAPFPFWFEIGLPSMGGPLVTASGLVFIGAAMDGYLRAVDVETGEELWKTHLPAGGQATPMTYRLRADGRQFVVIAAGGHGSLGVPLGDSLVAFALP
jgi:quinoprotein glucose dehydrogenase